MAQANSRMTDARAKASAVAKAKALAPDLPARLGSTPKTTFRGDPDVFGMRCSQATALSGSEA